MASTDETTVRAHLGGVDETVVPDESIAQAISEAHEDLLRDLKAEYAESSDEVLKQAETELASAYLLRMIASKFSLEQSDVYTPMLKVLGGRKVEDLLRRADQEERRASGRVRPYLEERSDPFAFGLIEPEG